MTGATISQGPEAGKRGRTAQDSGSDKSVMACQHPATDARPLEDGQSRVTAQMVSGLEKAIDDVIAERGMPDGFLVPGSNRLGAALDLARATVRRAERRAVTHAGKGGYEQSLVIPYLNRLADYLFMLARAAQELWTSSKTEENNP